MSSKRSTEALMSKDSYHHNTFALAKLVFTINHSSITSFPVVINEKPKRKEYKIKSKKSQNKTVATLTTIKINNSKERNHYLVAFYKKSDNTKR